MRRFAEPSHCGHFVNSALLGPEIACAAFLLKVVLRVLFYLLSVIQAITAIIVIPLYSYLRQTPIPG